MDETHSANQPGEPESASAARPTDRPTCVEPVDH